MILSSPFGPVFSYQGDGSLWIPLCMVFSCLGSPIGLWLTWMAIRGSVREFQKGKKMGPSQEEVLDSLPKKKQVMFKGEKVPEWRIAARLKATKAILKFLACTDNWFDKKYLSDVSDEAFRLVKEAIEVRSLKSIERRVTPECFAELKKEIKKLREEQEVHVFGKVQVTNVDIVQVEAPVGKEHHTFTALISAKSKDFVEDEEDGEIVRGDDKTYSYQEFWTFRRTEKRWVVELIRPSNDLDQVLSSKNVMAKIDRDEFAQDTDPEFLKEVVAR